MTKCSNIMTDLITNINISRNATRNIFKENIRVLYAEIKTTTLIWLIT